MNPLHHVLSRPKVSGTKAAGCTSPTAGSLDPVRCKAMSAAVNSTITHYTFTNLLAGWLIPPADPH